MFSTVSWHDFFVTIAVLLVTYYTVLVLVFYRNDIATILREGLPRRNHSAAGAVNPVPENILEELTALFEQAAQRKYHREELMQALQSYLKDHGQFKGAPFQFAVNNHITESAASLCNISLEDADIRQLW